MTKKIPDKNEGRKERFLKYFRETPIQKFAAGYIGVNEDTITDWKKADSDFSDSIELAKAEYVQRELNMVRSREWKLERIFKGDFAQRNELTGKDGEALEPLIIIKHGSSPKQMADGSLE
jgi:hypothetical protein